MLLKGRTALVTGAAGKIGAAIARRLAEEGCRVIMTDIKSPEVEAVARDLERELKLQPVLGAGPADALEEGLAPPYGERRLLPSRLDVTSEEEVAQVFAGLDRLDILVNNAGVTRASTIAELTLAGWREVIDLNLTSVFLCTKHALPLLRQSSCPAIVNIGSINALRANPGFPAYSAAKSGIMALTRQLVMEGAAWGLRANCISPASIVPRELQSERQQDPDHQRNVDCYPLGRLGYPEDVANAVLFLASELSAFINGVDIPLDGGLSAMAPGALIRDKLRARWKQGRYAFVPQDEQILAELPTDSRRRRNE
ncbi:MAG: hypothetical protein K0R57_5696 [Paenibacillaceae bacterium]|nr:hypothetical protein [Paenibacillaceae bacterium]